MWTADRLQCRQRCRHSHGQHLPPQKPDQLGQDIDQEPLERDSGGPAGCSNPSRTFGDCCNQSKNQSSDWDFRLQTSDIPTNMPRENQILWVTGSAVQPSAGLPSSHSFHGEVCRSGRLLLSIPLVQLCAAHTPKPRRARFRAPPGSAPLRRLTAPPCAPSLANYETNVFYWPAKAQFKPLEGYPKCPHPANATK